jgi:DegV family protein with EDD domain
MVVPTEAANAFSAQNAAGYARMAAWSELLDAINVFPVADGDTGRNLCISLTPLREMDGRPLTATVDQLIRAATGNSGNIAAAFLTEFLKATTIDALPQVTAVGALRARQAIGAPCGGTMLDIFDTLAHRLAATKGSHPFCDRLLPPLVQAVRETTAQLPALSRAKLIDAGALAMYLFFEGFFSEMDGRALPQGHLPEALGDLSHHRPAKAKVASQMAANELCVNAMLRPAPGADMDELRRRLDQMGDSVVALGDEGSLKVHLHASDLQAATDLLADLGTIDTLTGEALYDVGMSTQPLPEGPIHIMTDAAGSLSRRQARQLGVTLLDSFVVGTGAAVPETLLDPETVYERMRVGEATSTAQASNLERHQRYAATLERFERVLYLSVGSVYTGNVAAARQWRASNDPEGRLTVLDTGAASGRLGLISQAVARFASRAHTAEAVIAFARKAIDTCGELVFLDQLKYLAAGGRISKTSRFFGDLFRIKPVVTPTPRGVEKVGVVRRTSEQLPLALKHLADALLKATNPLLLLQYTDNRARVAAEIQPALQEHFPAAEIVLAPLSLTAGVHMGPGTWAVAWLAEPSAEGAPSGESEPRR